MRERRRRRARTGPAHPRARDRPGRRLIEETAPLAEAGKLGAYLLQLTPRSAPPAIGSRSSTGSSRSQLAPARGRAAEPELGDEGRREATLDWFADRDVTYVTVDAPPADKLPDHAAARRGRTRRLAYLRAHGRNTKGYLTGRSVAERFGWQYSDDELEEIAGRARTLAEKAGEVHVAFNNNRGDDAPTAAQRFRALLGQEVPGAGRPAADVLGAAELEPDALGTAVLLDAPIPGEPLNKEEPPAEAGSCSSTLRPRRARSRTLGRRPPPRSAPPPGPPRS